jgi:hypothetical protein
MRQTFSVWTVPSEAKRNKPSGSTLFLKRIPARRGADKCVAERLERHKSVITNSENVIH